MFLFAMLLTVIGAFFLWITVVRPSLQNWRKSTQNRNDMDIHAPERESRAMR